jgi:hypothetical protein
MKHEFIECSIGCIQFCQEKNSTAMEQHVGRGGRLPVPAPNPLYAGLMDFPAESLLGRSRQDEQTGVAHGGE